MFPKLDKMLHTPITARWALNQMTPPRHLTHYMFQSHDTTIAFNTSHIPSADRMTPP